MENKLKTEKLFIYGLLRDPKVQKEVFGGIIKGKPDRLYGYKKSIIKIEKRIYPALVSKPRSFVKGLVIELTPKQLKAVDNYETKAYQRVKVVLKSKTETWVYIKRRN